MIEAEEKPWAENGKHRRNTSSRKVFMLRVRVLVRPEDLSALPSETPEMTALLRFFRRSLLSAYILHVEANFAVILEVGGCTIARTQNASLQPLLHTYIPTNMDWGMTDISMWISRPSVETAEAGILGVSQWTDCFTIYLLSYLIKINAQRRLTIVWVKSIRPEH